MYNTQWVADKCVRVYTYTIRTLESAGADWKEGRGSSIDSSRSSIVVLADTHMKECVCT